MRPMVKGSLAVVLATGAGPGRFAPPQETFRLTDSTIVLDATTGREIAAGELVRRLGAADLVLLGELHDNGRHHEMRGRLIAAQAARQPAIVFEQFQRREEPIPPPAPDEDRASWLDRNGFDRQGWKWPLHQPVVEAAITHG